MHNRDSLHAGGIRLWPSDRTSPEFLGLQFSNVRGLLKGATLNGIDLQRTDYGAVRRGMAGCWGGGRGWAGCGIWGALVGDDIEAGPGFCAWMHTRRRNSAAAAASPGVQGTG